MKTRLIKAKVLISILFILVFSSTAVLGCDNYVDSTDIVNVKNRIIESYVKGIFLKGDYKLLKEGWHPDCDIVIFDNGKLQKLPAKYWVDRLKENPKPLDPTVTYKFTDVKITGYAALAIVEIYSNGNHLYTDYMCLCKFNKKWKIVTKIFYAYPTTIKSN